MAIPPPERLSDLPQSELPQWVQEINVVRSFNSPQFMSFINEFKGLPVTLEGKGQELPQTLRDKGVLASYRDGNTELFNDTKIIKNLDNSGSIELLSAHEEGQDSAIKRKFEFSTENNELSRLIYKEEIRNLDNTKSEVKAVVSLKDGKQIVEEVSIKSPDGSVEYSLKGSERSDKLSIDGSEWSRSKPSEAVRVTPGGTLAKDLSERLGAAPAEVYVPLDQDKWNAQLSDAAKRVDSRVVNDRDRAIRPGIEIARAQAGKKAEAAFMQAEEERNRAAAKRREEELLHLPKNGFIELKKYKNLTKGQFGEVFVDISSENTTAKANPERVISAHIFHNTSRNELIEPWLGLKVSVKDGELVFTGDAEVRRFTDKVKGSTYASSSLHSNFALKVGNNGAVNLEGSTFGVDLLLAFADKDGQTFEYDKQNRRIKLKNPVEGSEESVKELLIQSINEQLAKAGDESNKDTVESENKGFSNLVDNIDKLGWSFWEGNFDEGEIVTKDGKYPEIHLDSDLFRLKINENGEERMRNIYINERVISSHFDHKAILNDIIGGEFLDSEMRSRRAVSKFIELVNEGIREELNNPISKTGKSVDLQSLSEADKFQLARYNALITKFVFHGMQQESKVQNKVDYRLDITDKQFRDEQSEEKSGVIDIILDNENIDLTGLFPGVSKEVLMLKLGNALNAGRIVYHQLRSQRGIKIAGVYKGSQTNSFSIMNDPEANPSENYGDNIYTEFPDIFLARRIRESFIQNQDFFRAA